MDFERWRQLRGPVFRRDGAEIVALLDVDAVRERPQVAGEALLIALDQGTPEAGAPARDCAAAASARGWDGDSELAGDLQRALGQAGVRELTPVPVELEQLADLLHGGEHSSGGRLNVRTGEAVPALAYADGQYDDELDDEDDIWLYVDAVGPRESWRDMDRFIDDEVPAVIAASFRDAIEGKGAFSRFRAQLDNRPELLDSWRLYSEERRLGRARQWLADEGYRPGPPASPTPS